MRTLMAAWRATTREIRRLCLALWFTGGALLVAGGWGDTHAWWDRHAFLSNVASSAASGLLGVPFAIIVVQHITARQSEARERRDAQQVAARLAAELAADACRLSSLSSVPALQETIRDARATLTTSAPQAEPVRRAYEMWTEVVSSQTDTQILLSRMAATWHSLQHDVRPRLVRARGSWLDAELVNLLDEILSGSLSPDSDLAWMDGIRTAGNDLSPARLRPQRGTEMHLHRLDQADRHTRQIERLVRYTDDVHRHFEEPNTSARSDLGER